MTSWKFGRAHDAVVRGDGGLRDGGLGMFRLRCHDSNNLKCCR
jgi:hypothetical protein